MTDFLASRYQLVRVLGEGAMGVVWLAQDTVLDRPIALKELRPAPGVDASEAMQRFLVEARAAARLSHPNIVGIHDVFADGERVLIAMDLVEGPTLENVLRSSGPQSPEVVRAIMAQVAQALAVAHGAGVIHRDLKPDNIFWTPDGRAVVTDFGLARIGAGRGTVEGTIMGTPGYMAPEQVRGTPTGPASDVFAWGAVAYTLATGTAPFGEPSVTDPTALAYRIVHEDPPPLVLPDASALAELITASMAKEPSRRPADGAALVAVLSGGARPAIVGMQVADDQELDIDHRGPDPRRSLQVPIPPLTPRDPPPAWRRPWPFVAAVTTAATLGGAVAIALTSGAGSEAPGKPETHEAISTVVPTTVTAPGTGAFLGVVWDWFYSTDGSNILRKIVIIREVVAGSPAEGAGLRPGDLIPSLGGRAVAGPEDFQNAVSGRKPGDEVDVTFRRGNDTRTERVTLASWPPGLTGDARSLCSTLACRPGQGTR